jgi:hypothetical protein
MGRDKPGHDGRGVPTSPVRRQRGLDQLSRALEMPHIGPRREIGVMGEGRLHDRLVFLVVSGKHAFAREFLWTGAVGAA